MYIYLLMIFSVSFSLYPCEFQLCGISNFSDSTHEDVSVYEAAKKFEEWKVFKRKKSKEKKKKKEASDELVSGLLEKTGLVEKFSSGWTGIDRYGFVSMLIGSAFLKSKNAENIIEGFRLNFCDVQKKRELIESSLSFWGNELGRFEKDLDWIDICKVWNLFGPKVKQWKGDTFSLRLVGLAFLTNRGTAISKSSIRFPDTISVGPTAQFRFEYKEKPLESEIEIFFEQHDCEKLFIITRGGTCFPLVVTQKGGKREYCYSNILDNSILHASERPLNPIDPQSLSLMGTIHCIESIIVSNKKTK